MATFPTYAQILYKDYSKKRESSLLRSEMESGPPKQARYKYNVMEVHSVKIYIDSKANFLLFETWYKDDLSDGANWFDFVDPISGSTISARFRDGGYTASPMTAAMQDWEISAQIETWST
jgi:hypothetical protein